MYPVFPMINPGDAEISGKVEKLDPSPVWFFLQFEVDDSLVSTLCGG
jgi:hypothetical protein